MQNKCQKPAIQLNFFFFSFLKFSLLRCYRTISDSLSFFENSEGGLDCEQSLFSSKIRGEER